VIRSSRRQRYYMRESDIIRLRHILDASYKIINFADKRKRGELDRDEMLISALIRQIEIIGEAATKISNDVREQLPEIPWRSMIGMRNMLIHMYDDVNLDTVWYTIRFSIPKLIEDLEKIPELK
jgi:uncharacterized protein with HEPN domain